VNAKLIGVEKLEMEEVNAAAKKSLQRVEPKLWLFLWGLKVLY
jgi:hypothetical protein